jgi:hypothetical protein
MCCYHDCLGRFDSEKFEPLKIHLRVGLRDQMSAQNSEDGIAADRTYFSEVEELGREEGVEGELGRSDDVELEASCAVCHHRSVYEKGTPQSLKDRSEMGSYD